MFRKKFIFALCCIVVINGLWHHYKPIPKNLSYAGPIIKTNAVSFLYDLTYKKDGQIIHNQHLFNQVFDLIDAADSFIVLDMFLFNDDYDRSIDFMPLANNLTQHLIQAQKNKPLKIIVITDEINTFYGAYTNPYLEDLKRAGIEVIITPLDNLKDSNPLYSTVYRSFIGPFGVRQNGFVGNPFSPDSPQVSISSFLRMLNFKANHRKMIITDKSVMVLSANPHDASSNHSNIGVLASGSQIIQSALSSEQAVINLSQSKTNIENWGASLPSETNTGQYQLQLLTEKKILDHMQQAVKECQPSDSIDIGVFYLSHRGLIKDLIQAADRGVQIRVILDANKDAFGREKNGVPNRPVASELIKKGNDNIQIRWYLTNGEQFHAKYLRITHGQFSTLFGGSCNFTRRNFNNFNLESDFMVTGPSNAPLFIDANQWYSTIWNNTNGQYTGDFDVYKENSLLKGLQYRIMDWTGLCTF